MYPTKKELRNRSIDIINRLSVLYKEKQKLDNIIDDLEKEQRIIKELQELMR